MNKQKQKQKKNTGFYQRHKSVYIPERRGNKKYPRPKPVKKLKTLAKEKKNTRQNFWNASEEDKECEETFFRLNDAHFQGQGAKQENATPGSQKLPKNKNKSKVGDTENGGPNVPSRS